MRRPVLLVVLFAACSPKAVDVARRRDNRDAESEAPITVAPPPKAVVRSTPAGAKPKVLAKASSRALLVDASRVYFGDGFEDTLVAVPKEGGYATRLARRAPVAGGMALDGDTLSWIAAPGDVVLRVSSRSIEADAGAPAPIASTLRDHGLFADIVAGGGEIFLAEAQGANGIITRISGASEADAGAKPATKSTRLATVDGAPRAMALDATHCYVVTSQKLVRASRAHGDIETLSLGADYENPALDGDWVYVVAGSGTGGAHDVVRVKKTGGPAEIVAKNVRAAPIAVDRGEVYFFDSQRSRLMAVTAAGGTPRIVAQDDPLSRPNAIAIDADMVYVAAGDREDGFVLAIPRK